MRVAVLLLALLLPANGFAQRISYIVADSAFNDYFADTRERYKDKEIVLCIYATVSGDTAEIAFIRPARILEATANTVKYMRCPRPNPKFFGQLEYLGTWHFHHNGADCGFSMPDTISFNTDTHALAELLSCSQGLVARYKTPYPEKHAGTQ